VFGGPGAPGGAATWPAPGRGRSAAQATGGGGSRTLVVAAVLMVVVAVAGIALYKTSVFVTKSVEDAELRRMLDAQPDFKADCEGIQGKLEFKGLMAQRGSQWVLDARVPRSQLTKDSRLEGKILMRFIVDRGRDKAQVVIPELRAYGEESKAADGVTIATLVEDVSSILNGFGATIKEEAPASVGNYAVRVFSIDGKGPEHKGHIYVAPDLKNLIVKVDVDGTWTRDGMPFRYTLSNVAFDIPDDLFHVPITYNKVDIRP
jgi:hypothetical protein